MKNRVILGCLLTFALLSCCFVSAEYANVTLNHGLPIGERIVFLNPLAWENGTHGSLELVANRTVIQGNETIFHELRVYDYSLTERANASVQKWLDGQNPVSSPYGYKIKGIITEVDHHEPYGVLETRIEVLAMLENNTDYDWYDVSVYQTLTPGANYTSDWEWNWLTYTMNGTWIVGNIMLSEYDPPPSYEAPTGIFTFLWRILGFDLRNYLPWMSAPEPRVLGTDMSDYSIELFRVRYSAPDGYKHKNEPLTVRHHYVVRVPDNLKPVFWHQTQVEYKQSGSFAQVPYITEPLASGYIRVR